MTALEKTQKNKCFFSGWTTKRGGGLNPLKHYAKGKNWRKEYEAQRSGGGGTRALEVRPLKKKCVWLSPSDLEKQNSKGENIESHYLYIEIISFG